MFASLLLKGNTVLTENFDKFDYAILHVTNKLLNICESSKKKQKQKKTLIIVTKLLIKWLLNSIFVVY